MQSSTIQMILRSSVELNESTRVTGASATARAFLMTSYIQAYHQQNQKLTHFVIICPNEDTASELVLNLKAFNLWIHQKEIQVFHFPTWEQSAYTPVSLSLKTRFQRLSVLSDLAKNTTPCIIVTSLPAVSQATLPREVFLQFSTVIKIDQNIQSREALVSRLLDAGYLRIDPVEDPGTFAVRGDIIDIFPPDQTQPLRIELFDQIVEKIRKFNLETQRTLNDPESSLSEVVIPPAREVLVNQATSKLLREKLKIYADDLGIQRAVRDPVLESIREGIYPEHSDTWAPFAYTQEAYLWDYFSKNCQVIWNDENQCLDEWKSFFSEQEKLHKSLTDLIVPPPHQLFHWTPELKAWVELHSKLYLDAIEWLNTQAKQNFAVSVQSHSKPAKGTRRSFEELENQIRLWMKEGFKILILASTESQIERIQFLLTERNLICQKGGKLSSSILTLGTGFVSEGFCWPSEGFVVLTESEILGSKHINKPKSASREWSGLSALSDLSVGDRVVHIDHGLGIYLGLVRLDLSGAPSDFLLLEYANKDKLYLPVYRLNVIQKYVGAGESAPLDRLGSQLFAKAKEKVRDAVKRLAFDLVQLYAKRKIQPGIQFSPRDSEFREFEARFPFDETPDQLKAIEAVLSDLESGRVMDRLVCGDVGYGKTEIAIRAAFKAVSDGKQVVVLVPTTILAQQHEQSFKARMKDYPIIVESISRFKNTKEQKGILEALSQGKIDIVVGTHRLLSKDVHFHDLGLIIVDEEHRFGVGHKEILKTLKINCHVLTLTATPIPRTLHMALSGLRDISLINTPPVDRLPIRTYVSKYDEAVIKKAIEFEISRGGQVFYLHNRVQSIYQTARRIQELIPGIQVLVAHGQIPEHELEETMIAFSQKKAHVLICTTIIESGLDLPNANTVIIERADALGLSQLYQIRGRVGRGQQRAYAYLFIPSEMVLSDEAKKRLEVIQRFVELGSGFQIASHDLEIRGGGDLLGPQQSGNIAAVGFDLYTELLEEAIHEIQGNPKAFEETSKEPEIKIPFPAFLSETYVPDVHQRLTFYRRFSATDQDSEVDRLEDELRDRFGAPPPEAQNLFWLIRIKILLKRKGIEGLTVGPEKISLFPGPKSQIDPVRTIALISAYPHQYQLTPDSKLVAKTSTSSLKELYFALEKLFFEFCKKIDAG